ncbi:hypothetical protein WJX81_005908 [Elliptochloris bilobata]|uniref:Uncharacterized protein n=1 Tax=Elliptochloris bilobata TaxID=381761 RepID=A0AAW1R0N5_9CHLO
MDAMTLYEAAQDSLSVDDFDSARLYLRQAVQLAPQNLELLDALGALLAEAGPAEEAVATLQHAVALSPDAGFEKYMYLGQLLHGNEALASLQKGVQLLQAAADAEGSGEGGDGGGPRTQLAGALCALAEMHLAQVGDAAAAEGECEALLERARRAAPSNPEPLQVLASLRVEQGRPEEALAALPREMGGSGGQMGEGEDESREDAADEADGDDSDGWEEASDGAGADELPSYEFRFEAAKLLLELDSRTDAVAQVLEGLLAEDDSVPDVWYLAALCAHAGGDFEAALEAIAAGERLLGAQGQGVPQLGAPRHANPRGPPADEDPDEDALAADFIELQAAIDESVANIRAGRS